MNNLTCIKHDIDLTDWELDAMDEAVEAFKNAVRKGIAEALKISLAEEDTYVFFPIEWYEDDPAQSSDGVGNAAVDDPLTVYLRLGFEEGPTTYAFNLRTALETTLKWCREDGSHDAGLRKLSGALRELADDIDEAIAEGERRCPR